VLSNDEVQIATMLRHGKTLEDARKYLLIGCYEPAVEGKEISCTMACRLNLPKAVELAMNNGVDPRSGERVGPATGDVATFTDFAAFQAAFNAQLVAMAEEAMAQVRTFELDWASVNPSPVLSATMQPCMDNGRDVSAHGTTYNNSGCMCGCFANAVDSLMAVRQLVFTEHRVTLPELQQILANNWADADDLYFIARERVPKWGNNHPEVDRIGCDVANLLANTITGKPNSRGGIFEAALFSIDYTQMFGRLTGALPDGHRNGEPLAKNCCAMTAMDKRGVTALIHSVTKLDFTGFPDGSVLDIMLHPTAVQGEEGLQALMALIRTYFARGGAAIQFNIFD
jgi:formate C-acetyltransferase